MIRALAPWALAAVGAVLLALSFGLAFPESNQNTYLVHGLVLHDPSLLPHDWYVRQATDYHHAFSLLVAGLFALKDGPAPFVALDVVLVVVGALAWFSLARRCFGPVGGALVYGAWLALGMLTGTDDVMGSYVFGGYLQPSSIGTVGYLWALAFFVDAAARPERGPQLQRLAASGGALAVGAVFHLNFLVLGIATLGLAHLAWHRGRVWTRDFWLTVAAQMALPALVLWWASPQLLEATRGPTAQALPILFEVRAPHHFRPTLVALAPFFAWQAAAWCVVAAYERTPHALPAGLTRLLAGVGGFVVVASLLSTVVRVPQVAQVFPWRIAPVATAIAFALVLGAALRWAMASKGAAEAGTAEPPRARPAQVALLLAAALATYGAAVASADAVRSRAFVLALGVAVVVSAALERRARARGAPAGAPLAAAAPVVVVVLAAAGLALRSVPLEVQGLPKARKAVTAWAREHTPKDATFAVPPDLESFRLMGRRAIVVDWKSSGMLPVDVVAWAARMEDSCGAPLRDLATARQGYSLMDEGRARLLMERYGVAWFVFDKKVAPPPTWSAPVYENDRYAVLPAPPAP